MSPDQPETGCVPPPPRPTLADRRIAAQVPDRTEGRITKSMCRARGTSIDRPPGPRRTGPPPSLSGGRDKTRQSTFGQFLSYTSSVRLDRPRAVVVGVNKNLWAVGPPSSKSHDGRSVLLFTEGQDRGDTVEDPLRSWECPRSGRDGVPTRSRSPVGDSWTGVLSNVIPPPS